MKEKSVAFTGHRFVPFESIPTLKVALRNQIRILFAQGYTTFYNGGAVGFDMLAAEAVLSLKGECNGIKLINVIACRYQDDKFSDYNTKRYNTILSKADETIVLFELYTRGCFLRRDDYLVEHADYIVSYYDGRVKGGTYYTCNRAKNKGLQVFNMY